jgi:hypothetical protein
MANWTPDVRLTQSVTLSVFDWQILNWKLLKEKCVSSVGELQSKVDIRVTETSTKDTIRWLISCGSHVAVRLVKYKTSLCLLIGGKCLQLNTGQTKLVIRIWIPDFDGLVTFITWKGILHQWLSAGGDWRWSMDRPQISLVDIFIVNSNNRHRRHITTVDQTGIIIAANPRIRCSAARFLHQIKKI